MPGTAWGLDLGRWSTKIIRATHAKNSDTIELDLYDSIDYADLQCGQDAPDVEKYREAIRVFGEEYDVEKNDSLCVSIPGGEVFSRFISLPPVPERIGEIVRYEARQQIPFDMDRVVWDYEPVVKDPAPGEEMEVGIFAIKQDRIDEFMDMLRPWEDNLEVIQCAPLSVHNALAYEGHTDEPLVVLDIGAQSSDLLTINYPRFWMRPLLVGGDSMTSALADTFGVSQKQAETVKKRVGGSGREPQVLRAISDVVGNLVSEVQRSLGYYKSIDRDAKLDRMVVLGNTVKLPALARLINLQLQYEVEEINELSNFSLGPNIDREDFSEDLTGLWGALGLVVQAFDFGRISVNLIPQEIVERKESQRKQRWLIASAGLAVVMMAVFGIAEIIYGQKVSQKPQKAVELLDTLGEYDSQVSTQQQEVGQLKERLESVATTQVSRSLFIELLPRFAQYLPDNVFLTRLRFDWVSPAQVQKMQGEEESPSFEGGSEGTGGGSSSGPLAGGTGGSPGGPGAGGRSGTGGGGEESSIAKHGMDSRLVIWFEAESARREGGLKYIKQNVFERLRQMQMPGENRKAFQKVGMVGDPTELYRSSVDGRIVSGGEDGGSGGGRDRRSGRRSGRGSRRERSPMGGGSRRSSRRERSPGGPSAGRRRERPGQREEEAESEEERIYFLRFRGYALLDLEGEEEEDQNAGGGGPAGGQPGGSGAPATGSGPSPGKNEQPGGSGAGKAGNAGKAGGDTESGGADGGSENVSPSGGEGS